MIGKPGLRYFHQAKFTLKDHDHQLSNSEVIQFHLAIQVLMTCQKQFVLPFDMASTGIAEEELSMVSLFEELA